MKQVVDLEQVRIKAQTREPVLDGLPLGLGAFEKNALEEAVRIKEQMDAHITVLAVGSDKLKETIKEALAIGADEAVIVTDVGLQGSDAAGSARTLAAAVNKIGAFDLILTGEGSADEYSGQVPSRLAELLGLPQVTYVRELNVSEDCIRAVRDLEDALEVVETPFPALVSVTGELNEPRLPGLTAILRAGRKPMRQWNIEDIGLTGTDVGKAASAHNILSNLAPEQKRKGILYRGPADEAVQKLLDDLIREGVLT